MLENRIFHRAILCALLSVCALCGVSRAAQMELMQDGVKKGPVGVVERDGDTFVALDGVMSRLAFVSSPVSGGFVVTYGGGKMEFWNGSSVARVNGAMSPLAAAVTFDGTHWWGEAASSIETVEMFLSGVSSQTDISLAPAGQSAQQRGTPAVSALSAVLRQAAAKETQAAAGEIVLTSVRWGKQLDAYRAVVDISGDIGQASAVIAESQGRAEVTFSGASALFSSSDSPWPHISAESAKRGQDTVLTFTHPSDKVKGFWIAGPPRYVIDFYFSGVNANAASPVQTSSAAAVPAGETQTPAAALPVSSGKIETTPKQASPPGRKKFIVMVDAGHGGHDGGALGNKLKEKDLNLLAALQLGISLKEAGMDARLTRQDDRYLKLAERTEAANAADADVFISLHCNALPKGKHAAGTELYLMAEQTDQDALDLAIMENRELSGGVENSAEVNEAADKKTRLLLKILGDMQQSDKINESTTLAEFIYNKMRSSSLAIRKVRQAPFFVLRGAGMPALLIEMGYITEAGDAKKLNSQPERKKMMEAIAAGIMNYLSKRPGEGGNR